MMKVNVGGRTVKVLRQWEKDMLLAAGIALGAALWIAGYLGSWIG